jgi:hypothetical protein
LPISGHDERQNTDPSLTASHRSVKTLASQLTLPLLLLLLMLLMLMRKETLAENGSWRKTESAGFRRASGREIPQHR